ncbi:nucleoside diphosphate kinase regulator [Photobacterium atrarenae]|uniref:Nucleoside diphosphate kinase regulator n=1 Tax=Photobacterium atrarenae TaxID=865757 RepID=A0ABY5GJU7_9GAMM|nr:nucleoside diphosphate kinase regulator [Photobacterium atrarenae]UTV29384.1 nucleoside diphosphate kinase regulator [Photobacterium atrarenae]
MTKQPSITISSLDAERLDSLLENLSDASHPGKAALEAELDRADIVAPEEIPADVVTMNSTVRFVVESSQEPFCLTLVYPNETEGKADRISILAPVGSALLGLSVGDSIEWPKPGGGMLHVRIEAVLEQPERSGAYHR